MIKIIIQLLKLLDWGSALTCRLTYWTGKAPVPTHPKHLVNFGQLYYLPYLKRTDQVLDLGCHAGEHSFKAARRVNQVVGLDINPALIKTAQAEANRRQLTNINFRLHNLEK